MRIVCFNDNNCYFLKTWFKFLRNSIKDCSDTTEHSFSNQSETRVSQVDSSPAAADWLVLLFISPHMKGIVVNIAVLTYMPGSSQIIYTSA